MRGLIEMTLIIELITGVLLFSFLLNLIPFTGPSNMLIALTLALAFPNEFIAVGFLVALGSALAKSIHYIVSFFIGKSLKDKHRKQLDKNAAITKRWAMPLLFIVASTPLPDEPIVYPLGIMKYNPVKFFSAYFVGKLAISLLGAYFGFIGYTAFSDWISPEILIIISIALTIVITIVVFKVDLLKVAEKVFKRKIEIPLPSSEKS